MPDRPPDRMLRRRPCPAHRGRAASSGQTVPSGIRSASQRPGAAGRTLRRIPVRTTGTAEVAATPALTAVAAAAPSRRPDHSAGGSSPGRALVPTISTLPSAARTSGCQRAGNRGSIRPFHATRPTASATARIRLVDISIRARCWPRSFPAPRGSAPCPPVSTPPVAPPPPSRRAPIGRSCARVRPGRSTRW